MADQRYREIQLGGKQLVFLFMTSVVIAVAIFLLGISVGRGVRIATGDVPGGTDVVVAPESEADLEDTTATEITSADLSYHDLLQEQTTPSADSSPTAQAQPAAEDDPASAAASEAAPPEAVSETTTPVAEAGWYVQFGAFSSRANADRRAATLSEQLRGKGYGVVSVMTVPTDTLFRVRMGPFPARADAQGLADRLVREERITPSVLR